MTGKYKPKPKSRIVETSLGKAPKESEQGPDLSHLRTPITTSVTTLREIFNLFQTATQEVQNYITYECDILYECRVCRTLFRSLANFILHKRSYCRNKWHDGGHDNQGIGGFVISEDAKTSDEDSRCTTPLDFNSNDTNSKKRNIMPIIDKLLKRQKVQILAKEVLNEDLSKNDNSDDDVVFVSEENNVVLQKIDHSGAAVFQTKVKDGEMKDDLMKSEVLEIHDILDNNQATLDAAGKVAPKSSNLVCTECNSTFSTEKTLTHHIRYKHNKTCTVFPCPDCKETFSNTWNVYRHLYRVHSRTPAQVRRMRYMIHSSGIRKDQEPEKKKKKPNVLEEEENEENQWMNNFEGDKDIQMCGGCGKRFERRAALHSHSQMCTKRIAICNSIKNVKVAKSEKKEKENVISVGKVKGAAKRKQAPQTRNRREEIIEIKIVENVEEKQEEEKVKKVEEEKLKDIEEEKAIEIEEEKPLEIEEEKQIEIEEVKVDEKLASPILTTDDVTITRDGESTPPLPPPLPEMEILTISDDDSNDSNRKPTLTIPDEYKEYVTDVEDHSFLSRMMPFIDKDQLKCAPCETTFLSLYMLLRHMSLHFSWFRFQCRKCSFVSFHKYDCTTHAYSRHSVPNDLIESTVMPIPRWKVLSTSHDFKGLDEERVAVMPLLEPEKVEANGVMETETIILEDDEMPDITENGFTDPLTLSDDEKKVQKREVSNAGPSLVSSRPIRNRTRSVKTAHNDFIYDPVPGFLVENSPKKRKKGLNKV